MTTWTQKAHLHLVKSPEINGLNPMPNVEAPANSAIGTLRSSSWYKSLTTPPATVENTELPTPVQNLQKSIPK